MAADASADYRSDVRVARSFSPCSVLNSEPLADWEAEPGVADTEDFRGDIGGCSIEV